MPDKNVPQKLRIRCLMHVPFEGPGAIEQWGQQRGHDFRAIRLFAGEPLPEVDQTDLLVVMGGPMSAHDEAEYSWLLPVKALIARCLERKVFVLGICLGSQLLAGSLGAVVRRHTHREIGWYPVTIRSDANSVMSALPAELMTFHWHGETYDVPPGALLRASSEGCAVQAFEHPAALGLQFHLEVDRSGVEQLLAHCGEEIGSGPFEQQPSSLLAMEQVHGDNARQALFLLLEQIHRKVTFSRDAGGRD